MRDVRVTLSLIAAGFQAGMAKAKASTDDLIGSLEKNKAAASDVSTAMLGTGTAILAGVGMTTKAAMDWESAWAGVLKTVDGTDEQLRNLEGSLREMARTMPATHQEIAAVAEAAGQLGIAVDDVAEFTRVMIMLGETTNLTADEAATSFAQFMNIMGTAPGMVGNLGAALVELGNNGASTEADILRLSMRIAAAGKAAGMSEADVLGFAAAMANVGIEAEAGGTAMSQTFAQIDKAVRQGGESLDLLASISGMTAAEFARAWGTDAAGAAEQFILGLGDMQSRGESAKGALDELGMSGIRQSDTLMRLALSGEKFSDALRMGETAITSTSALLEEYGKRAATTEARVQVAWNNIKDAAIEAGAVMLPVVAELADGVALMASTFANLPGPVQAVLTVLAGIAGVGLVAGGGLIKLAAGFVDLRGNVKILREEFPRLDSAMGKLSWTKAVVGAAALTAGLIALTAAQEANRRAFADLIVDADDLGAKLLRTADQGKALNEAFTLDTQGVFSGVTREVDGLGDALSRVLNPTAGQSFEDFFNGFLTGGSAAQQMRTQFEQLDQTLAGMVQGGNADAASRIFDQIAAAAQEQGIEISQLAPLFEAYSSAMRNSAGAAGSALTGAELLAGGLGEMANEGTAAVTALTNLGNMMLSLSGSQMGFERSLNAATEAIKEHGQATLDAAGMIDIGNEKGLALQAALDGVASSALSVVDNMIKTGAASEDVAAFQARAADEFLNTASAMGLGTAQAIELAAKYGLIPRDVATAVTAPGADLSRQQTLDLIGALQAVPSLTNAEVLAPGARPSKAEVDEFVTSIGTVPGLTEAEIRTIADLYGVQAAKAAIASVQSKTVTVTTRWINSGGDPLATRKVATGGYIAGPGTGTSDSIPALLSNGEYVIRAASVAKLGRRRLDWLNLYGDLPRFAAGGMASAPTRTMPNYVPPAMPYAPQAVQSTPQIAPADLRAALEGMSLRAVFHNARDVVGELAADVILTELEGVA